MAEIDDLYSALEKADAAGNAGDAKELANMIRSMESAKPAAAPAAAPAAPAADGPRNAEGKVIPDVGDAGTAFATHAGDALTFGAMGPIAAYIATGASRLTGNPISYAEARRRQQAEMARLAEENPWSAGLGTVAGSVAGGLGLAKLASKALPGAVRAVTPQAADSVLKVGGRLAAGGAAAGAGSSLAETGVDIAERELGGADTVSKNPITDAVTAGGIGAVAGPVVGGLVGLGARGAVKARDALNRNELGGGWRYLSRKLDVEPQVLRDAMDDYARLTGGQKPSIAQVMDMKQQGVLAEMARSNPRAGVVFREAAEEGGEALPGQVRDQVRRTVGAPRTAAEMEMATSQPGDMFRSSKAMENTTLLTPAEQAALRRPDFIAATRDLPPELRGRVAGALQGNDELSVNELDMLRRHIAAWGDSGVANKGPAQALQKQLTDIAERTSPGYSDEIIAATRSGKLREEGFAAGRALEDNTGVSGGSIRLGEELEGYGEGVARRVWDNAGGGPKRALAAADELASSRNMQDALDSAYGSFETERLVSGARALRQGQRALEEINPGRVGASPSAAEEARGIADAGGAVAAVAAGHPASIGFRLSRLLPGGISEQTAGKLAEMLVSSSPAKVAQAIANLRRAGADNRLIAEVQGLAARVAGDRSDPRSERRVPLEVTVRKRAGQ